MFINCVGAPDWNLNKSDNCQDPARGRQRRRVDVTACFVHESREVDEGIDEDAHQRQRNENAPSEFPVNAQTNSQHEIDIAEEVFQS